MWWYARAMQPNGPWQPPYQQPQQQQAWGQQPGYIADPYGPQALMYRENAFVPYGATAGPLPNPVFKKIKLALGIGQIVALLGSVGLMIGGAVIGEDGAPLALVGGAGLGLWYLLLIAHFVLTMMWFHAFWSWVPPEQRWTSMWKKYISPGTFIGFMFIPYFNIYWLFVTYLGLADVMERMRVQYPTNKPPAKTLAIVAIVGGMLFFPVAPFLQYFFQKHLEDMARDMTHTMPARMV